MNVFILKIIALISMIIDHYGAIFQDGVDIYRIIGRIAFPIYCFLLVEGYTHTSDIKKYLKRLLIFAFISEIPFDFAFYGSVNFGHQNIFFTLSIGLITIYLLDKYREKGVIRAIIISCSFIIALIFAVDYNFLGIIYILLFHTFRDYTKSKKFLYLAILMFLFNLVFSMWLQEFSLLALSILYLYNGNLGPRNKFSQMFFYIAYPLHLLIFYIISVV